jgi:uncharacterized protein (TIGR02246 family)
MKNILLGITVVLFLLCGNAAAQTKPTADETAVKELFMAAGAAWGSGDISAYANCLTENSVMVGHHGEQVIGRDAIRTRLQWVREVIFKKSKSVLEVPDMSVSFVDPDVAMIIFALKETVEGSPKSELSRNTIIATKAKGEWKIAFFQATSITEPPKSDTK